MDTGSDQKRDPEGALAFLLEGCSSFLDSADNPLDKAQRLRGCMAVAETHLTPVVRSREERLEEALKGLSTAASRIWMEGGCPRPEHVNLSRVLRVAQEALKKEEVG